MKKRFKIISLSLQAFLGVLLVFSFFALITSKTPLIAGIRSFVVLTGSMEPAIKVGSVIFARGQRDYKVGDIIAFTNKADQTVTHRIMEVINNSTGISYKVKGDANNTPDGDPVEAKSVTGKTIFVVPYLGRFVQFLKTLPGFIGLIVVPSLIFIGIEVWNIKKEMEKEIEKKVLKKMNIT